MESQSSFLSVLSSFKSCLFLLARTTISDYEITSKFPESPIQPNSAVDMAAVQLNFTLRTSTNCKTVHLLGSWDGYKGQLPLSKDSSKAGGWKGTFRFQGATLKQGQRYWYYYIIDGYHVSHDPARESVTEPTTSRKLNVLDIPSAKTTAQPPTEAAARASAKAARHERRISSSTVPKGRSLSPSQIKSPRPTRPTETSTIRSETYHANVEQLSRKMAAAHLSEQESSEEESSEEDSDAESAVPSLSSSRSSNSSSPSSVSSTSSCCTCERYGITRAGNRVKLDCGGNRCGYSDGSECSSESEEENVARATRRQGVVIKK
ncbi:hypothetical protein LTR35_009116 [Friedmanniomyces endolithicus]|uniref:AMP-activated protein kinase glycogen-binding domain-containing protein n=2 Tax=Dothideomycetidae TaxID=451867 RepID=A0AAN6FZC7_9PEZI|nr:hypothetical protein LTR35_009116 [Friedmanniomyces endolithicus]KAK0285962.1 hypothetical protein LTS00_010753 [Friedmanniomyces endolithicus]KAK0327276.1 hypothetical protein LTR82_002039 [Friedmanniomyces endolithicus]KAK1016621.1 hypothetical protein LTR54_003300 [Friedmanniomyces endolithicus]